VPNHSIDKPINQHHFSSVKASI